MSMIDFIEISPELRSVARLGLLQMEGLTVRESPPELKSMLDELARDYAVTFANAALGEVPAIRRIRAILHRAGLDPTRHRASSEALLRRAVKGKGLYFINSAVDLVNYFSLKTLWPVGLYDVDKLKPPLEWRIGRDGESYEGIGRDRLNLAHFPLLVDREGPFGSPVSDSIRTRVTEATTRILWITFAPSDAAIPRDEFAEGMARFNGGTATVAKEL